MDLIEKGNKDISVCVVVKQAKQTDSKIKHFDEVAQEQVDRMLIEKISIRAMARILGFNYTKYTTILKYIRKKQ